MAVQVTDNARLHFSAIPAPVIGLVTYVLSPEFLGTIPDKYAHIGYAIAGILALFTPALVKKTNPDDVR